MKFKDLPVDAQFTTNLELAGSLVTFQKYDENYAIVVGEYSFALDYDDPNIKLVVANTEEGE